MSKLTDYKILIAEDEESLAMLIDYNLIKNGYKTKIVKDGDFVLSDCETFCPDLILLDWMLPNISGIELCRRLRTQKKYNNIPHQDFPEELLSVNIKKFINDDIWKTSGFRVICLYWIKLT